MAEVYNGSIHKIHEFDRTGISLRTQLPTLPNLWTEDTLIIWDETNIPTLESATYIFDSLSIRNNVDISNARFDKCTNIYYMFHSCYFLTDVSNFNTSSVLDMDGLFSYCSNLRNIPNDLDTSNVRSMRYTFNRMSELNRCT